MPFLAGLRTKAREKYEERKEKVKTSFQKYQEAKPQAPQPITKQSMRSRGMITNGIFVGNGAGLTGIAPKRKKKAKKSITVKIDGQTIKITRGTKSKKRKKHKISSGFDITHVSGGILG